MPGPLLILGAGGHGCVVAEIALGLGYTEIERLDDDPAAPNVMGPLAHCQQPDLQKCFPEALVAIGNARLRLSWIEELQRLGFTCPALVHPRAWVSPTATLGAGTVVMPQAAVMSRARLGRGCIVNTAASIDHECVLADGVHVCPGAHLAGAVQVGTCSWIGIGSSVIQGRTVGDHVTVGAGAAVVQDLASGVTAVGVPARPLPPRRPEP